MKNIYPSLLGLSMQSVPAVIRSMRPLCSGFHLDFMDGYFVPNVADDRNEYNAMIKTDNFIPWVHLMVYDFTKFYTSLLLPEESIVTFHCEIKEDKNNIIKIIREKKHRVSVAINPKTPIAQAMSLFGVVDQVLLMSVEPGFSGQRFLKASLDRLDELVSMRQKNNYFFRIGIDGGINKDNIVMLAHKGVDDFAIGGGIFSQSDPVEALKELNALLLNFK